jgi:hypothetical protein
MNILALILIIDASILASMDGPDLPDDFRRPGTTATVEAEQPAASTLSPVAVEPTPKPELRWEVAASSSGIVKSTATVKERWLVSEPWCPACPAAKKRFLASGGSPSNIITIAKALELHGRVIDSVPREYTTEKEITLLNPAQYRSADKMEVLLEGSSRPGKDRILKHLRTGGPHQGKHWQAWSLESWSAEQLYALHDDDHAENVPTFESEPPVVAAISGAQLNPQTIAAALAVHLHQHQGLNPPAFESLFDITVDTPDSARGWIADMLSKQSVDFPSSGFAISWKGGDRTISVAPGRIQITPGATVSVQKFGVSLSTTLRGVTHADDLNWITLELDGAPDLTVRFE